MTFRWKLTLNYVAIYQIEWFVVRSHTKIMLLKSLKFMLHDDEKKTGIILISPAQQCSFNFPLSLSLPLSSLIVKLKISLTINSFFSTHKFQFLMNCIRLSRVIYDCANFNFMRTPYYIRIFCVFAGGVRCLETQEAQVHRLVGRKNCSLRCHKSWKHSKLINYIFALKNSLNSVFLCCNPSNLWDVGWRRIWT